MQLASLLANQHQRAKEEMKCLPRAQATVGVALTNHGSTVFALGPNRLRRTQLIFWIENECVFEQRFRNSPLQKEIHSGERFRCFPGCSEKI